MLRLLCAHGFRLNLPPTSYELSRLLQVGLSYWSQLFIYEYLPIIPFSQLFHGINRALISLWATSQYTLPSLANFWVSHVKRCTHISCARINLSTTFVGIYISCTFLLCLFGEFLFLQHKSFIDHAVASPRTLATTLQSSRALIAIFTPLVLYYISK